MKETRFNFSLLDTSNSW